MICDAHAIADGTILNTDICVIGGGPAGVLVARAFIGHSAHVTLLESGGIEAETGAQDLNDGEFVGTPYAGLRKTRHRQLGGTACIWNTPVNNGDIGAKYVPLDECDFEPRPATSYPGWPFSRVQLETFYKQAQVACGLGAFEYSGNYWDARSTTFELADSRVRRMVYQFGPASLFTKQYTRDLQSSENVEILFHATACMLKFRNNGRVATTIEAGTLAGTRFRLRAGIIVLAAGAIENARLLLVSKEPGRDAPGDQHGWLGRCFMEHPRDYSISVSPADRGAFSMARFYDRHLAKDGTAIAGRIALNQETLVRDELSNSSLTLLPLVRHKVASTSMIGRALVRVRKAISRNISDGYGWSENPNPDRAFHGFRFILNTEQWPNPNNRLILGRDVDQLGVPKVEVHWRWRAEDQHRLDRACNVFAEALQATGIGKVKIRTGVAPDPNAHHHSGTTRMYDDCKLGVVDPDGRVYGTDNIYVSGASVFPTSGFANPTLTIVALAIRLAEHLKGRF
jgi:choline dehydrogenase-like flavoprotein